MLKLLLPMILPLLVAPLTVLLGRVVLNARRELDNLPAAVKQGVIIVISAGLTAAGSVLGAELCPADVTCGLDNFDQQALVSALLAFALHNGKKNRRSNA